MTENRNIAKAAGLVGFFTLLSRVAGLLRDAVIGYYFGSGLAADAFFVAFRIPNLLRRFVAEGAMSVAFIPVFTEYLTRRSRTEAHEAIRAVTTVFALLLAVLTVAGVIFAPIWTRLFAPGFAAEPGKLALTTDLTRWVFPYILCVSLVALMSGILNALRHFAAPALSPLFFNLSLIAGAVIIGQWVEPPVYALAYAVVLGGCAQIALQIPPLAARGISLRPLWRPAHEAIGRIFRLMAPTVFGAAVYQINLMVDTILASMLPSGAVSYLWYADRVFEFPLGIFAVALGTAALPSFSAQASRKAYAEMNQSLVFSLRLTSFITIPAAVGIAILAAPITSVLFRRGAFGAGDTEATARALAAFAVGLWSVSVVRLLVPAFYALQNTRTPVITAAAAFASNVVFSLMLMGPVTSSGASSVEAAVAALTARLGVLDLRHAGLALSTSLSATLNVALLALALRRRLPGPIWLPLLPSLARSVAASAAMAIPVIAMAQGFDWNAAPFAARAAALAAAVAAGIATYGTAAWLLRSPEIYAAWNLAAERLSRRRNS